jgi:2'-5' RNA ligase
MENWKDWQKPYQYGILLIWPPDEVREIVNAQRKKYDPVSWAMCEAHITVTQMLRRHLLEEEWGEIRQVLSGHERFEITYGPVNSFLPYPCLWYEVHPRERVLALRRDLHATGYFNLDLPHPQNFMPHMTITEQLSGTPVVDEALLAQVQAESRPGRFRCDSVAYVVPDADFHFKVVEKLPLGSRTVSSRR